MVNNSEQAGNSALTSEDYEEIVEAVMETSRGRWFLNEYAKHNRNADTQILLDAIAKLEATIPSEIRPTEDASGMRAAIAEMANEINATKRELQTIGSDGEEQSDISSATAELDAVVDATENAASDILEAAEAVQEMAWTLREENVADAYCDALDMRATEIYTACSFQDITGQRTKKVVGLLQNLDQRISTLASIWADPNAPVAEASSQPDEAPSQKADAHLLNGPALDGEGVSQTDIDDMLDAASWNNDTEAEVSAESQPEAVEAEDALVADSELDLAAEAEVEVSENAAEDLVSPEVSAEDVTAEDMALTEDSAAEDFAAAEMNAEDMLGEDAIERASADEIVVADASTDEIVAEDITMDDIASDEVATEEAVASLEDSPEAIAATSEIEATAEAEEEGDGVAFEDLEQKDMDALFA